MFVPVPPVLPVIVNVVFNSTNSPSFASVTLENGAMATMLSAAVNVGAAAVPLTVEVPL